MTTKDLAALLDGREYGNEITQPEAQQADSAGLVVVYGASDDLMEFEGAISDEIGVYGGGLAWLYKRINWTVASDNDEEIDNSPYPAIRAIWNHSNPDCSWLITTSIPHVTFNIMENGELYCRGIVFHITDIQDTTRL
jgi:hypothetical protein